MEKRMGRSLIYNGTITAEQFLFYEIRIASKYYLDGTSVEDAIEEIKKNNLFQYPTERLVARMVRSCYKRLDALDDEQLRQELSSAPVEIAKQINLYAMMRYNRIVWDFMVGVIGEKFRSQDFEFSRKDLNVFFSHLQEQNDDIAGWSESTVNKIKQVLTKILVEVEILDTFKSTRLNPLFLCEELEEGIRDAILDKKQSILFLNRRGNSRYLVCMDCGDVPQCPRCSVHLTYHSSGRRLMCHYCGYVMPAHARCEKCGGAMKAVGSGTQKIEQELKALFPDTEVLRMDADTVPAAGGHEAMLKKFREQQIPILLGTQMVAKGLDFPSVTLVGVIDADMSLYVDNFRAAETTFSLITQVVGRSGRGADAGCAMIQTMTPEHPVLRLAAKQDYDAFYELELQMRQLRSCPPFSDLFTITVAGLEERGLIEASVRLRDALAANLQKEPYCRAPAQLLGPAPASVARVNYSYRYQLTLICKNSAAIRRLLAFVLAEFSKDRRNKGITALIDINSYQ